MKVIIADDEPLARVLLRTLLEEAGDIEVVAEVADGLEAAVATRRYRPDVLFLDIDMPLRNGIQAALDLAAGETDVIFVTAHEEHAVDAFELGAIDYVLKPVRRVRLALAIERARRRRAGRLQVGDNAAPSGGAQDCSVRDDAIWISHRRGATRVALETLVRVEAARDHVYLHTADRAYLHRITMTELEGRLAAVGLLRVHRSAFVRPSCVRSLRRSGKTLLLELDDGATVPVGPSYRAATLAALGRSPAGSALS